MPDSAGWWAKRRERRQRRRERIRNVLLGGAPPLPKWARVALPVGVAALGYICYRFRLTSAKGYEALALGLVALVFIGRRIWWRRQQARADEGVRNCHPDPAERERDLQFRRRNTDSSLRSE